MFQFQFQFQFQFVYLPLRITWIEAKKKFNYLDSHGEEAQKKLAGL